jgi:RNA polymerase sigma-70 factor (ECF subfamily)
LFSGHVGQYTLQATISAVHAVAPNFAATDWTQIVTLYDTLIRLAPSPIVDLNRAVAVGMRDGPEAGLVLVDAILAQGGLSEYHLAYSARAELCRRLGRMADARTAYKQALALVQQEPEKRFLERRLRELPGKNDF